MLQRFLDPARLASISGLVKLYPEPLERPIPSAPSALEGREHMAAASVDSPLRTPRLSASAVNKEAH